ncbi:MAG: 30S ribosomal protein S4e [Methanomassiliicoccaceae archaeon]|nr:30S ribosomal protein S4e [Methanomassiliicoccaceae archaeon]
MSAQMKRLAAPRSWPLKRKVTVWVTKQSPGPHAVERSMPAAVVLRDMLKVCDTAKEAKRIIGNREVMIDGKPLRSHKMPIGLMDVITIPRTNSNYRMLLTEKGKLTLIPISDEEARWKLCRIENKTTVRGGKTQLNLHDGRNIVLVENKYSTGDTLKFDLYEKKITGAYPLAPGSAAMIIEGPHAGRTPVVSELVCVRRTTDDVVKFEDGTETVKGHVFIIGSKKPALKLPEASII